MNENNLHSENSGDLCQNNSEAASNIPAADNYTDDVFSEISAPQSQKQPIKPSEHSVSKAGHYAIPSQPRTPLQPPYASQQSPYSPVQNQPPRAPQSPYGMNHGYNPYQYSSYNRPQPQPPAPPQPEQNDGKGKNIAIILIAVCAVIAVIFIAIGALGGNNLPAVQETTGTTSQHTQPTINSSPETTVFGNMEVATTLPSGDVPNSVYVAQKVRPSVVGIMTYKNGDLYGEGSGVLMSEKDGWTYIITCAHVIDDEGVDYGVLLLDGTTLEAHLVAYDSRTDIGVIKVNETGLPLAEFGDSTTLQVGEPIYAVGNPGGSEYFGSITDGIVASLDRSVTSTYTMTCIQHNAAINPGNSGGALVNTSGQIIGINSSKIASTEFEGMGFAVPTSIAAPIVDSLINYGYVPNRPKLGIECAPVSAYQLYSIIVSVKELPPGSLVITAIESDSNLVGTTVEEGDLIIAVNGEEMTDSSVLLDRIDTGNVGDTMTLTIARINSRTYKVTTFDVQISLVEDKGYN